MEILVNILFMKFLNISFQDIKQSNIFKSRYM